MRRAPFAGALLGVALLAGCGAPGPTPQEWTDGMCDAVLPFVRTAVTAPEPGAGTAEQLRGIGDYLDRTTDALDRTLGDLDRLGPAPVENGEAVSTGMQGGLGEIRSAFSGARERVGALDPADEAAVQRDLPAALEPLSQLGSTTGPLEPVTGDPELAAAFEASAPCGELDRISEEAQGPEGPDGVRDTAPNDRTEEGGGG
ncbi:hypothetical protein ACFO4M_22335 [Pseudonocardia nematodicida]|uniref:hypothetical protein n=1 Tax=Pseudonocardia nematodicida TaxID=1206997 RepID=UPI003617FD64